MLCGHMLWAIKSLGTCASRRFILSVFDPLWANFFSLNLSIMKQFISSWAVGPDGCAPVEFHPVLAHGIHHTAEAKHVGRDLHGLQ